jgi:hypothetical protein
MLDIAEIICYLCIYLLHSNIMYSVLIKHFLFHWDKTIDCGCLKRLFGWKV